MKYLSQDTEFHIDGVRICGVVSAVIQADNFIVLSLRQQQGKHLDAGQRLILEAMSSNDVGKQIDVTLLNCCDDCRPFKCSVRKVSVEEVP